MATDNAPPFESLDPEGVGKMLMWLPAISAMLRHETVQSSISYLDLGAAEYPREAKFVEDMLTMKTAQIVEKW